MPLTRHRLPFYRGGVDLYGEGIVTEEMTPAEAYLGKRAVEGSTVPVIAESGLLARRCPVATQ